MYLIKNIRLYTDAAEVYYNNCSQPNIGSATFFEGPVEGIDIVYMDIVGEGDIYDTDYSDWDVPEGTIVGVSSLGLHEIDVRDGYVSFCVDPDIYAENYYVYSADGSWPGGFPLGMTEFSRLTRHWFYRERGFHWDTPTDADQRKDDTK